MTAANRRPSRRTGHARRPLAWLGRIGTVADQRASGAAAMFAPWQRRALLGGFALLVILRLPRAWLHGRFLGEEGTIFLAYAWHRPAGEALLRSFGGYLNLGANTTTLLTARLVQWGVLPLEWAPFLTMIAALLFQLIPAVLILNGRGRWLASRWAIVAALLIVAIAPRTEEVFVNVLHIQFHLALCAALILALDIPVARATRIGYAILLLLAPLCGPGAILLAPFFALRTLIDRDARRLAQTIVFAVGTALQMLVYFTPSPVRGHLLDPVTLAGIMFVRLAALPLITSSKANRLGEAIYASYGVGGIGWWLAGIGALLYFGSLIVLALRRRDAAIWLIAPGLAIGIASFGGGMIAVDPRDWFSAPAGERYNFLPLVLISLGLIAMARRPAGYHRFYCLALCLATLVTGAIGFRKPIAELADGPAWNAEVAAWRRDADHPLATWPEAWTVDLSAHDRPCRPAGSSARAADQPSYCEGAWLERVLHPPTR